MDEELKQEVQDLKSSISLLSNEINHQFTRLNDNFSSNINQLSEQIYKLAETQALTNKSIDNITVNTYKENFPKAQKQSKIPDEYYIDYSYITDANYSSWLDNLKKYSKDMAECRDKNQITPFCQSARNTLESAIEVLFDEEYKCINENNKAFLEAYNRVKSSYDKRKNADWDLPQICVNLPTSAIKSENLKKVDSIYVDRKNIEKIRKQSLPASVQIFFEIIKPNYMETQHLKETFLTIMNMNKLRNLKTHGSKSDLDSQLNQLGHYAKQLYDSSENFETIQKVISWFVREIYKRVCKISNN
ncbi:MAG: hypothetical protein V7K98_01330 [Nostoc sp.]|uniref:hypothetical protein n=1 Tax=Nostoc sp. TaxID=1180 RepID=UPI002FF7F5AC